MKTINLNQLKQSFIHAARGFFVIFRSEQNFRIQIVIAIFVIIAMFFFPTSRAEKIALLFMVMWVLVLEILNAALERFIDLVKPRLHSYAKEIKDLMAAAVLLTSVISIIVGVLILYPYLKKFILQ